MVDAKIGARLGMMLGFAVVLSACIGEPFSKRVGPGSTVAVTVPGPLLADGVVLGFGSALGGADAQRGELRFVLCLLSRPSCNPDQASPREGYRMQTTYATRVGVDALSRNGMDGEGRMTLAYFEVPATGPHRPPPNVYRLETRVAVPGGTERLAVDEVGVRTLEIIQEEGAPSVIAGNEMQALVLRDSIPRPAIRLFVSQPQGQPAVEAMELRLRYPSAKLRIAGVAGTGVATLVEQSTVDANTVRILFLRDSSAPLPEVGSMVESMADVAFELLPNAAVATAGEFQITMEKAYDRNGASISGARASIGPIF